MNDTPLSPAVDGGSLISYGMGGDQGDFDNWVRTQCRVDFTPTGFTHPDRDLLACLGWHVTLLAVLP